MVILKTKGIVGIAALFLSLGDLNASKPTDLCVTGVTILVQSPVIMRAPSRWDALSALLCLANLPVRCQDLHNEDVLHFKQTLGPFRAATVKLFSSKVNHLTSSEIWGGQVESVVATSVVQDVSWQTCVQEMRDVRQLFLSKMIDSSFDEVMIDGEMWRAETRHPGIAGWRIRLSAKRMATSSYLCSMIICRKHLQKKSDKEVWIEITE